MGERGIEEKTAKRLKLAGRQRGGIFKRLAWELHKLQGSPFQARKLLCARLNSMIGKKKRRIEENDKGFPNQGTGREPAPFYSRKLIRHSGL
jgi:hypothetical protein